MKELINQKYNYFIEHPFWSSKWAYAMSAVIIFYFISFYLAVPVNLTIYHMVVGDLYDYSNLESIANKSFIIHSKLITLGFILSILLIARKNINLMLFTAITFIVFVFPIYEFIDNYIHEILFKTGIYNFAIREGGSQVNPQYTRILLFILSSFVLLVLFLNKKTRTIDRTFMLLISGAVIITTFFFHMAIPMGSLKLSKAEKVNEFVKIMVEAPIGYACKNKNCFVLDQDFNVVNKIILNNTIKDDFEDSFIRGAKLFYSKPENKMSYYFKTLGNFIGTDTTFSSCLYRVREKVFLCSFDNTQMRSQGLLAKIWFSLLCAIAHFTWIFLGSGLLFIHKDKIIQKIVTSRMNQSKKSSDPVEKSSTDLEIKSQE